MDIRPARPAEYVQNAGVAPLATRIVAEDDERPIVEYVEDASENDAAYVPPVLPPSPRPAPLALRLEREHPERADTPAPRRRDGP